MELHLVLDYLAELERHNERTWFHEHKPQYQKANGAFEELVRRLTLELSKRDGTIPLAEPGDLTFKLMRDTRFSHDKSPYNPAFRAHIAAKGKLPIPVGYFLFFKPGDRSFLGGGLFADMFQDATRRIRDQIATHSEAWEEIITAPDFTKRFTITGTALKNVPKGYDPDHPQGMYLKHKSWCLEYPVTDKQLLDDGFLAHATEVFLAMKPFNDFLNQGLEGFEMPTR